ncbi:MAG: tRNA (adenosine(37)-N6)-dimethylallyltransferase MiaA [Elusimicrobia bacterium]|nr:tRNA (adenosine(37)-N6)-dimethylallyltransferase MiaA [Elusimicrobiota bacterium]MBU2614010.1 tRNA (adenosine(37)-N6)-dimethylallyltransferase MiaA [Elusimicrobiota bacterium]
MIFIAGPTGSGKTSVSIGLARKIKNAEIISADSRQIYKHLSVGTAKPAGKWVNIEGYRAFIYENIPHHLIDIIEPTEFFSAGDFVELSNEAAAETKKRNNIPIFVGGTGLYIDSFIDGIAKLPQKNEQIRKELYELEKKEGRAYLHNKLKEVDPESAVNIHPNNIHRIIRALEVYHITGSPISIWHEKHKKSLKSKYEKHTIFALNWDRKILYDRINQRVEGMLENGMIEETEKILTKNPAIVNSPALKSLGYKYVVDFLNKTINFEQMKSLIQQVTRNYAKRQLTWFNKNKDINWINCDNLEIGEITEILWKKSLQSE